MFLVPAFSIVLTILLKKSPCSLVKLETLTPIILHIVRVSMSFVMFLAFTFPLLGHKP